MPSDKITRFHQATDSYNTWKTLRQLSNPRELSATDLTLSEVKPLDCDHNNRLDDKELDAAGITDPAAREELRQNYLKAQKSIRFGQDQGDPVVLSAQKIDAAQNASMFDRLKLLEPIPHLLKAFKSSEPGRQFLEQLDFDNNHQLDLAELETFAQDLERQDVADYVDALASTTSATTQNLKDDLPVLIEALKTDAGAVQELFGSDLSLRYGVSSFRESFERVAETEVEPYTTRDDAQAQGRLEIDSLKSAMPLSPVLAQRYQELSAKERDYQKAIRQEKQSILAETGQSHEAMALLAKLGTFGLDNLENLHYVGMLAKTAKGQAALARLNDGIEPLMLSGASQLSQSERLTLIHDLLHDTAVPMDIDQAGKGTCGAVRLQTKVALLNPSRYVDICLNLAQEKPYPLSGQEPLKPNHTYRLEKPVIFRECTPDMPENAECPEIAETSDLRTLSAKIFQNALMDYAHQFGGGNDAAVQIGGEQVYFDSRTNLSVSAEKMPAALQRLREEYPDLAGLDDPTLIRLGRGFPDKGAEILESALIGKSLTVSNDDRRPDDMVKLIDSELAKGRPVALTATTSEPTLTHAILVTGKDETQEPPMYIVNTWRALYSLSAEELERIILTAQKSLNK